MARYSIPEDMKKKRRVLYLTDEEWAELVKHIPDRRGEFIPVVSVKPDNLPTPVVPNQEPEDDDDWDKYLS